MHYTFYTINNRKRTYKIRYDYIEYHLKEKDVLPFSISNITFAIPNKIVKNFALPSYHEVHLPLSNVLGRITYQHLLSKPQKGVFVYNSMYEGCVC